MVLLPEITRKRAVGLKREICAQIAAFITQKGLKLTLIEAMCQMDV